MKTSKPKTTKLKPVTRVGSGTLVMALARELFNAGIAHRRKVEGYNNGKGWKDLDGGQIAGWEGVAIYVSKNFKRHNAKLTPLPPSATVDGTKTL